MKHYYPVPVICALLIAAIPLCSFALSMQGAAVPVFEPDYTTSWDDGVIHTDNNGVTPHMVDWDGDGLEDLLVGVYYGGNIYFYRNYGEVGDPLFLDRVLVEADGTPISLSYG